MTLRLRLVIALLVLLTAGLAVFGVVTYSLYANSEYKRLDNQLRAAVIPVSGQLRQQGNFDPDDDARPGGYGPDRPVQIASTTYAELRDSSGTVVGTPVRLDSSAEIPQLPTKVTADVDRLIDTDSVSGSAHWRVLIAPADRQKGYTVVLAVPTSEVTESLRRLGLIEGSAAVSLLIILAAGAWLILRRGLHPLERMAHTAGNITAGDLSQRVEPADGRTEVGQLGLALNTMLGDIEGAFQERDQTELRLRQFLSDASHELRTPLTSIQGFAELYRLGGEERVELPIVMRRIEEEAARMKHLVEDLLLLARLDETRPVDRRPVDLGVLAADACTDAAAIAPDRKVTLDAPEPVIALGDEDHLRQAITNLVANAVKHTPDGTPITVAAGIRDGQATVSVRDFGPGLPADGIDHVFDRFWQADGARVGHGAGLGLSIVAAIADEHGGMARAENMPVLTDGSGGGARFSITLPLHATRPLSPG